MLIINMRLTRGINMGDKSKLIVILACVLLASCGTPGVLKFVQLSPIKNENVTTAQDLLKQADPDQKAKMPPNAMDIVVIGDDNAMAALSLYGFRDIYWLEVYVYNKASEPFVINASDFILMDYNRTAFRRLEVHEAANIYLGKLAATPPYQYEPKYIYNAQSSTSGYLYSSGYFTAQTTTTGTAYVDPWHKAGYDLGYAIGSAIVASYNKKLFNMAGAIYTLGFIEGSSIPGKTGAFGAVYWIKRTPSATPLILRIASIDYEVNFKPKPYVK